MIDKSRQVQLKRLLSEAVLVLCRNGLPIDSQFSIEAMIGITLGEDEVFLVSFQETVSPSSAESSSEPQSHSNKTARHSGRYIRKDTRSLRTGSATDICTPARQIQNVEDSNDPEEVMDGGSFLGLPGLGHNIVVKSEVAEQQSDYVARNIDDLARDEDCRNSEFEGEIKSELDVFESYEGPERDADSSIPIIDATSVISLCRRPMSSPADSHWLAGNHRKGRTRGQTLQSSTGSPYSLSSGQRLKDAVYQQETAESVTSVEKILSAIYPTTDNQSLRCHVCHAVLKCRRTLMEHIRGTHLSIHSYHCPDCGLGFKWRSSLKHHRARNCTLPSALAAAYDRWPPGSGPDPLSWANSY